MSKEINIFRAVVRDELSEIVEVSGRWYQDRDAAVVDRAAFECAWEDDEGCVAVIQRSFLVLS